LDAFAWESIDARMGNFLKVTAVRNYWESSDSNYPKLFEDFINDQTLVAGRKMDIRS